MKRAFTLIEVNLAMLIMAGGILAVVGLYSFGFKESRQSREDVVGAALADAVVSPLVMVISQTNLKWSAFRNVQSFPSDDGWGYFLDSKGQVKSDPNGSGIFDQAVSAYSGCAQGSGVKPSKPAVPSADWKYGLIVMHERDSPIVKVGFRAVQKKGQLLSMPLYYTEVRFQGIIDQ